MFVTPTITYVKHSKLSHDVILCGHWTTAEVSQLRIIIFGIDPELSDGQSHGCRTSLSHTAGSQLGCGGRKKGPFASDSLLRVLGGTSDTTLNSLFPVHLVQKPVTLGEEYKTLLA